MNALSTVEDHSFKMDLKQSVSVKLCDNCLVLCAKYSTSAKQENLFCNIWNCFDFWHLTFLVPKLEVCIKEGGSNIIMRICAKCHFQKPLRTFLLSLAPVGYFFWNVLLSSPSPVVVMLSVSFFLSNCFQFLKFKLVYNETSGYMTCIPFVDI